jgi:uncharacterized protein (TIGR02145 family)
MNVIVGSLKAEIMKTNIFILLLALGLLKSTIGQKAVMELTFTAVDITSYERLDSIKVINQSWGSDTVLYWPDTVLVIDYQVGISENQYENAGMKLFQNIPNPVLDQTTFSLSVPEEGQVNLSVMDLSGREVAMLKQTLGKGDHSFRFIPGQEKLYFLTAHYKSDSRTIKILTTGSRSNGAVLMEYPGKTDSPRGLKMTEIVHSFYFRPGDKLLYIGFANAFQSGIPASPETDEIITFQFATNIPCPGTPTVVYEGQTYHTIQIFSQCWLKENLNAGIRINSNQVMQNNGITEKYCYNNKEDSCTIYGGLYQWGEMMQYMTGGVVQGICPPGWHVPADDECKVLEGSVDSQYGIGNPLWNASGVRGFDAAITLKATSGWNMGCNGIDLFGFSALATGARSTNPNFYDIGNYGYWWTATQTGTSTAWERDLFCSDSGVSRGNYYKTNGMPVRCIRNY